MMISIGTHCLHGSLTPPRVSRDRRRFLSKLTNKAGNWYPDEYPWTAEKESQSILECVRMVAIEIEMAKPGFAPVTPPKQVSMAPGSPVVTESLCGKRASIALPGRVSARRERATINDSNIRTRCPCAAYWLESLGHGSCNRQVRCGGWQFPQDPLKPEMSYETHAC